MGILFKDQVKQISEGEAAWALREAWNKLYNDYPSVDSLALLWSQWALETGRGKAIHCYNFGNIKRSNDENYCMFRCNEILNGKLEWFDPPHKQTWFRAYPSAVDGALDYIMFLSQRKRYQKAWAAIQIGDPALFGHELKVAGYYTADEAHYTKSIVSLTKEFKRKSEEILAWTPSPDDIPTTPPRQSQQNLLMPEIPAPPLLPQIEEEELPVRENFLQGLVKKLSLKFR